VKINSLYLTRMTKPNRPNRGEARNLADASACIPMGQKNVNARYPAEEAVSVSTGRSWT